MHINTLGQKQFRYWATFTTKVTNSLRTKYTERETLRYIFDAEWHLDYIVVLMGDFFGSLDVFQGYTWNTQSAAIQHAFSLVNWSTVDHHNRSWMRTSDCCDILRQNLYVLKSTHDLDTLGTRYPFSIASSRLSSFGLTQVSQIKPKSSMYELRHFWFPYPSSQFIPYCLPW